MNTPESADIDIIFSAFDAADSFDIRRKLTTRLYLNPKSWHEVRSADGGTLLHAAASLGDLSILDLLINKGFAPDAWNNQLDTALHLTNDTACAIVLLKATKGMLALESNLEGDLPLHIHLRRADLDIVQLLLNTSTSASQVMRRNACGETPLFAAALSHPASILPILMLGADPRILDKTGKTAAHYCKDAQSIKILNAFCSHLTRCDEISREQAINNVATERSSSLAKIAKEFLTSYTTTPGHKPP